MASASVLTRVGIIQQYAAEALLFLGDFTSPAAGSIDSLLLLCGDLPEWTLAVVYSEFEKKRGKPLIGKKFRKQRAYCPL